MRPTKHCCFTTVAVLLLAATVVTAYQVHLRLGSGADAPHYPFGYHHPIIKPLPLTIPNTKFPPLRYRRRRRYARITNDDGNVTFYDKLYDIGDRLYAIYQGRDDTDLYVQLYDIYVCIYDLTRHLYPSQQTTTYKITPTTHTTSDGQVIDNTWCYDIFLRNAVNQHTKIRPYTTNESRNIRRRFSHHNQQLRRERQRHYETKPPTHLTCETRTATLP